MGLTIGVDIGGTKVLGGVVADDGTVLTTARRATPAGDTAGTLDRIIEVVTELTAAHPDVAAVGVGAAGWIDARRATVLFAPNLAWRQEPLRDEIAARIPLPLVVENDGNAAAWAEFRYGAGEDADDSMALFTVGTGIGGGLVLGGALIRGGHGMAGEPGHVLLFPGGHPCGCGRRGCLEQYASGSALVRFAREAAAAEPGTAAHLLELAGGDVNKIDGPMVTTAAQAGDGASVHAFNQIGYWLGQGLADLVQIVDPQVLVVGGGVIEAGELLLRPARAAYHESLAARDRFPAAEVRPALLGNTAGVVGAADLARR